MSNNTDRDEQQGDVVEASPRPWRLHCSGSYVAIRDANEKVVIRKTVSQLSLSECFQLRANFNLIVRRVNHKEILV